MLRYTVTVFRRPRSRWFINFWTVPSSPFVAQASSATTASCRTTTMLGSFMTTLASFVWLDVSVRLCPNVGYDS